MWHSRPYISNCHVKSKIFLQSIHILHSFNWFSPFSFWLFCCNWSEPALVYCGMSGMLCSKIPRMTPRWRKRSRWLSKGWLTVNFSWFCCTESWHMISKEKQQQQQHIGFWEGCTSPFRARYCSLLFILQFTLHWDCILKQKSLKTSCILKSNLCAASRISVKYKTTDITKQILINIYILCYLHSSKGLLIIALLNNNNNFWRHILGPFCWSSSNHQPGI